MVNALAIRRPGGRKRWGMVLLASLLAIGSEPHANLVQVGPPPVSLADLRLQPLRAAAARWAARPGPEREVVDQVCLVPDLATFLEAIAQWDQHSFYPVLIEEAESTLRFLRAFHPARVVRIPPTTRPIAPGQAWRAALGSVRRSWTDQDADFAVEPAARTVRPPVTLGPTPPGVVVSNPDSSMLAGAVALAAGRFQPLIRLDSARGYGQTLVLDEFREFSQRLATAVGAVVADHRGLGDDCDFVTVAGDYPYRYRDGRDEIEAVDDGIARDAAGVRWAFAGRILGDPAQSAYQAMCALFLQPDSATFINGYGDTTQPWTTYSTRDAANRLAKVMPVADNAGPLGGSVAGWFEAFDPSNRAGLVWINSHGSPTIFHLQNVPATTTDLPRTVPAAVLMIHSFSAADPTDPATIAGRWLANGAFVYFGSVHEPYLQAFRPPTLVADLIAEHLPLAAALRKLNVEPYGIPWRLEYLGDPLFRLKPGKDGSTAGTTSGQAARREPAPRLSVADRPAPGPLLDGSAESADGSPASALRVAVDAALVLASTPGIAPSDPSFARTIARLEEIDRDQLSAPDRTLVDLVLADLLFESRRRGELRARIESIPLAERSRGLNRWLDAIRVGELAWMLAGSDFQRIAAAWTRIYQADDLSDEFRRIMTARVGIAADELDRRADWTATLRAMLGARPTGPGRADLLAELKRVESARRAAGPTTTNRPASPAPR